jgi:sugar phosphate isomerase/epimerase
MLARLREVADVFGEHGVMIGLETGQESAEELADVLTSLDHPQLGVNFDPANVILYGRDDPMGAFASLRPWISQVHLKDARGSGDPERWGTEVPLGDGEVPWDEFFAALASMPEPVAAVIEREAGEAREVDVRQAATRARDGLGASIAG